MNNEENMYGSPTIDLCDENDNDSQNKQKYKVKKFEKHIHKYGNRKYYRLSTILTKIVIISIK